MAKGVNKKLRAAFSAVRAEHPTLAACRALPWARASLEEPEVIPPLAYDKWVVWETKGGLTVQARVSMDDGDMGEFRWGMERKPGAVRRRNVDRSDYAYFYPEVTYEEHRKGLRECNFGRHEADCLARCYVKADYERAETFGRSWWYCFLEAKVLHGDEVLAVDSLGGVCSDDLDGPHGTVADVIEGVLVQARSELSRRRERRARIQQLHELALKLGYRIVKSPRAGLIVDAL